MTRKKVIYDDTRDEYGNFVTGCRITEGTKYVTYAYLTNWQGSSCKYYRIPKEEFTTVEQMFEDIWRGDILPYKVSEPIR